MKRRVIPSQKLADLVCDDARVQSFFNQDLRKHVAEVYQQFNHTSAWEIQVIDGEVRITSETVDSIALIANSTRAYTTTDLDFSLLDEDPNFIAERSIKVARTSNANIGGFAFGSSGTLAAPAYPTNGDVLFEIRGYGWDANGATFTQQVKIFLEATETWGAAARGTQLRIQATANGSTSMTTVAAISGSAFAVEVPTTLGASGATPTHRLNTNTATGATGGADTLPANPVGFVVININGTSRKIPYYAT